MGIIRLVIRLGDHDGLVSYFETLLSGELEVESCIQTG